MFTSRPHTHWHFVDLCGFTGMALAPWNVLAGGKIRTDEEEERRRQTGERGKLTT